MLQVNPNIAPINLIWDESLFLKFEKRFSILLEIIWFNELDQDYIVSTLDNLFWALIPSYSPLFHTWQIMVWVNESTEVNKSIWNLELTAIVKSHMENVLWDTGWDMNNMSVLVSQFSWILIKHILHNKEDKFYIHDKLFRNRNGNKEYKQLEFYFKTNSIDLAINHCKHILNGLFPDEAWEVARITKKFFYFLSLWFEFEFRNINWIKLSFVGWFIDPILLNAAWISDSYFLLGCTPKKFFEREKVKQEDASVIQAQWVEIDKAVSLNPEIMEMVGFNGERPADNPEMKYVYLNSINKPYLFSKSALSFLLMQDKKELPKRISVLIDHEKNTLEIDEDTLIEYWKNFLKFIEHYYGWKPTRTKVGKITVTFTTMKASYLLPVFENNFTEYSKNSFSLDTVITKAKEMLNMEIYDEENGEVVRILEEMGFIISQNGDRLMINIPKIFVDIHSELDILNILFPYLKRIKWWNHALPHRDCIAKIKNNINLVIADPLKDFLIHNWFDQVTLPLIGRNNFIYKTVPSSDFEEVFSPLTAIVHRDADIMNNNLSSLLLAILSRNKSKLPNRMFSVGKVVHNNQTINHLWVLVNITDKEALNHINTFYSQIHGYFLRFKGKTITLKINNQFEIFEKWISFDVYDGTERIWLFWSVNEILLKKLSINWKVLMFEAVIS